MLFRSKRSRTNRIHLDHLYELNCLVRQISNQELTLEQINQKIHYIKHQKLNFQLILIGYIVSAAMFLSLIHIYSQQFSMLEMFFSQDDHLFVLPEQE